MSTTDRRGRHLDPRRLADLFHHRWAVPVLASIHRTDGTARFAALRHELDVNRASLRRALETLQAQRLVRRNEGYGHPLRPEYLLTARGRRLASWSAELSARIDRAGVRDTASRKWTLPALAALHGGCTRFRAVQYALLGVSDRALALALRALEEDGLVVRQVYDERPARIDYGVTPKGERLGVLLERAPG